MRLVTGATGFLGSHIVEQLVQSGQRVRALVRPTSDTAFLDTLPVEKVGGDLSDQASLERACEGIEVVYHAAAEVSDWGPWAQFHRNTIEGTRNVARAALQASVRRFVHVSTIGAYGNITGDDAILDETAPLGRRLYRWSYYGRAKAQAEHVLWRLYEEQGLPLTVIRPSWIYGPRDHVIAPRLHRLLTRGRIAVLGDGNNAFYAVFAADLARACLMAADNERAIGQAYNCADGRPITQKDFLGLWAEEFHCSPPQRKVPYRLAMTAGFVCECIGRLFRFRHAPSITRHSVWILGRCVFFPTDKIRRELGWSPKTSYAEGVRCAVEWYLGQLEANRR